MAFGTSSPTSVNFGCLCHQGTLCSVPYGRAEDVPSAYNTISVYFRDMLFYRKHSVAWCFLNNQPTWACLVTCIHSILDFGVVKSKLNLHLYITGSFYTVVFLYRIFFLVSYISVMNLANCLTFGSVINDSISFMVWLAVWSKSNCRLSA